MRKRGRSRLSSATKRARRFKAKYTADTTAKRAKVLLPVMYPQMEKALIDWDMLEVYGFTKFAECGVTSEEEPYYMAWLKRKAELGLRFDFTTREAEYLLLKEEFVSRGLDPDKLDCVEPSSDDWLEYMRQKWLLEDFENWNVNGWTVTQTGISTFTVVEEAKKEGVYGGRFFQGSTGQGLANIRVSKGTSNPYAVKGWFKITSGNIATGLFREIAQILDASQVQLMALKARKGGDGLIYAEVRTHDEDHLTTYVLEIGKWYYFQIIFKHGVDGYYRASIDTTKAYGEIYHEPYDTSALNQGNIALLGSTYVPLGSLAITIDHDDISLTKA